MKFHLILVLFIAALVAVPCFAEEVAPDNDEPLVNGGQPLADEDQSGPPENGNKGDEEADEEDTEQDQSGPPENGNKGDEEADEEGAEQDPTPSPVDGVSGDELEDEEEIKNHPNLPEEIKDEVKDAVKRRVLLSARCCLVLKRYKFCRNSIIRRLCYRQCRPPPVCKNLISPRSCWLVRNRLRRCRHHIGRVYCRYTCGYCKKRRRWVTSTPYWCGHRNRRLMKARITLKQCQALCLRRRGCNAVEWWGKYNFNCYQCLNYRLMKRYSNTRDLAWPPYVSRYI